MMVMIGCSKRKMRLQPRLIRPDCSSLFGSFSPLLFPPHQPGSERRGRCKITHRGFFPSAPFRSRWYSGNDTYVMDDTYMLRDKRRSVVRTTSLKVPGYLPSSSSTLGYWCQISTAVQQVQQVQYSRHSSRHTEYTVGIQRDRLLPHPHPRLEEVGGFALGAGSSLISSGTRT